MVVSQPKPDTASDTADLSPEFCGLESEVDDETESDLEAESAERAGVGRYGLRKKVVPPQKLMQVKKCLLRTHRIKGGGDVRKCCSNFELNDSIIVVIIGL